MVKDGGALYMNNSKGNIKNTLFQGNRAPAGGSILLNTSVPEVTGCLFNGDSLPLPPSPFLLKLSVSMMCILECQSLPKTIEMCYFIFIESLKRSIT